MNESVWTHLGIIAVVVIPLIVIWLDLRNRQGAMHRDNIERLTRVETKIEPVWQWWNRNGRPDH